MKPLLLLILFVMTSADHLGSLVAATNDAKSSLASNIAALPKGITGPTARSFDEATAAAAAWREKISFDYYDKQGDRKSVV